MTLFFLMSVCTRCSHLACMPMRSNLRESQLCVQGLRYAVFLLALVSTRCTAQTLRNDSVRTSSGAPIPSADGVRIPPPPTGDIDTIATGLETVTTDSVQQTIGATSAPGGSASNMADTDPVHGPRPADAIDGKPAMGMPGHAASPPSRMPGKGTGVPRLPAHDISGVQTMCQGAQTCYGHACYFLQSNQQSKQSKGTAKCVLKPQHQAITCIAKLQFQEVSPVLFNARLRH